MERKFNISTSRLSAYYLFALFLIALLIGSTFFILSNQILDGEKDSNAVNLFGRQRMLSQKLLAESLLLIHETSPSNWVETRNLLMSTLSQLSEGHVFLLEFPLEETIQSTNIINRMNASIQSVDQSFNNLKRDVDLLLNLQFFASHDDAPLKSVAQAIFRNSADFLTAMDRVVFEFDDFAQNRVRYNQNLHLVIVISILGLLGIEAILIFRPMIIRIVGAHEKLDSAHQQLQIEIKERKKTEKDLILTKQMAWNQDKLAAIGRLSAGIVHEIGNPLAAMHGLVNAARDHLSSRNLDDVDRSLLMVKDNLLRLESITREVSDFSSPNVEEMVLVNLNELVVRILNILKYDVNLHDIEFVSFLNQELPAISGNPDSLMQVLMNLVLNSADAIHRKEGSKNRISLATVKQDGFARVTVRDQGVGMDQESIGRAFEPFQTTKHPGEGMGIGLYLCHEIVRFHDGEISIASELGKGTTVSVKLPIPA